MELKTDYSFYNLAKYKITLAVSTSVFFMLFLLIFQPFGVNNYATKRIFTFEFVGMLFAIMILILAVLLVNEFFLRKWFIKNVSALKILIWSIWTCILLGIMVFLFYNWLGDWHDFSLLTALEFILDITTVSLFPMLGTFFYFRYRHLHEVLEQVVNNKPEFADHEKLIHFEGQGVNDDIKLTIVDFIYGKAQDNYVELVYRKNNRIAKTLIRVPLSVLSERISSDMILKCHRSYIVNLYQVRAVRSGSDMKLFLNFISEPIKVSKSYRTQVEERLQRVKTYS